ncbi:hypothetical protein [Bartonella sp. MM73XJBT.G]|uniref:hypothetical protein n=1 Tax=Bartonella sp. MM73XJBT.G TaxID=3019097 RepID=UPI00235E3399|nr:hypothetical protein [Bartonella sp. MM73XJBT.G]
MGRRCDWKRASCERERSWDEKGGMIRGGIGWEGEGEVSVCGGGREAEVEEGESAYG